VLFAKICIGHFITRNILFYSDHFILLDQCTTALMCSALVRPIKFAITFIVINNPKALCLRC